MSPGPKPGLTPGPAPLLSATDLVRTIGQRSILDRVSLDLFPGETLGLVGESGSGKSTLARMLLGLLAPDSGSIRFNGQNLLALSSRDLRHVRRRIGVVFQDPFAALNPRMRVRDLLAEPFHIHRELPPEDLPARLAAMLAEVGLDQSALPRFPHEFSGGQRQRLNIARALALRPDLLILDEPVSALDVSVGAQVINLIRSLKRLHGLTTLFITHSMPLVRYLADRIAVLERGRIVETGPAVQLCEQPTQAYTRRLLAATPSLPSPALPQTSHQDSVNLPLG